MCPCGNCVANAIYIAEPAWGYADYCATAARGCPGLFCDCTCGVHAATVSTELNTQSTASDDQNTGVVVAVSVVAVLVFAGGLCFGASVARWHLAKTAEQKPLMKNVQLPTMGNRSNRPGSHSSDKQAMSNEI